jgi:hypothetical protein
MAQMMRKPVFTKRMHPPAVRKGELPPEVERNRISVQQLDGGGCGLCRVAFNQFHAGGRAM